MATIPITTLLDTEVLIDILRAHLPAQVLPRYHAPRGNSARTLGIPLGHPRGQISPY